MTTATQPSGASIIAGRPERDSGAAFRSINPATGEHIGPQISVAANAQVDRACREAADAFKANRAESREQRAALLDACAERIQALADTLVRQACEETGLAPDRITMERNRTVGQFRMFAAVVREGGWVDAAIDHAHPSRKPMPKPGVRRMLKPLGPAAVFGASNFPLAYSVGGGDTASALAAGASVVVKGHSAHPLTGELVAIALAEAVQKSGFHAGTFSFLQAGAERDIAVGEELVRHPLIRAVGFTGSVGGGMALVKLALSRPEPIPVFAEMGSVNPVFVLPGALAEDASGVADKLAASAMNSSGQMCTCPGLIFVVRNARSQAFVERIAAAMTGAPEFTMLTARTRDNFEKRLREVRAAPGVEALASAHEPPAGAGAIRTHAALFRTSFSAFVESPTLKEECFGPSCIVVECANADELLKAASSVPGSLTGSVFASASELAGGGAHAVMSELEQRVGRLICNGVPTGVEVCNAMVHSGPYPACSRPDTTAVGAAAIRRWCRPVCYQNVPDALLPEELRDANPLNISRVIDGERKG